MGCNCNKSSSAKFNPATDSGDLPELSLMKMKSMQPLARFEKEFPFYRSHIVAFKDKLFSSGKDEVDLKWLNQTFDTPAWNGQFLKGSKLYKLLKSLPGQEGESFSVNTLLLLGILWCQGDVSDKAQAFFEQLNPPGQNQDGLSANDKDWDKVFDRIVYMATYWTEKQAKELSSYESSQFPDEDLVNRAIKAMRLSEEEDKPELTGFILLLFGYESRMSKEEYDEAIILPKVNWVFSGEQIRDRFTGFTDLAFLD